MVSRKKKRKQKSALLGSHQKCWLWGRHVVVETLKARRWTIHELYLSDHLPPEEVGAILKFAQAHDVPVKIEPPQRLEELCHNSDHQGFLAKMAPYPYRTVDTILENSGKTPLFGLLDSIHDPHNFGAVIRCAEVLGVDGLFVRKRNQAKVTAAVARVSAGAVNFVDVAEVEDLVDLAKRLRDRGVCVVATAPSANQHVSDWDFRRPTAVVIGNEASGISKELLSECPDQVAIPQSGTVASLNAAVAAGIVFYEARRQRLL